MELEHIFIDKKSLDSKLAIRLMKTLPRAQWSVVNEEPFANQGSNKGNGGRLSAKEFDRSKRYLFVTRFEGKFFKRCPGARPGLTCCNYFVLNLGLQCNMNCSYCYLQSFINSPVMKVYSNIDQALDELRAFPEALQDSALRVGTGEVIDSLSLDPLTLFSWDLIDFFKDFPKWRLEFKTKSDFVDQFIDRSHAGNVIVSWSINPQNIISSEEHGTASLEARLSAARRAADKGFPISFHIDPMIWHPDWQINYSDLVQIITKIFKPSEIPYMSVGALRFQPEQRLMMRERFGPDSLVNQAELFPSQDGKLRYDHSLRTEMFQGIRQAFKDQSPDWNIFMCMESPETWLGSFEQMPGSDKGLKNLFDHQLVRKFNSNEIAVDNLTAGARPQNF